MSSTASATSCTVPPKRASHLRTGGVRGTNIEGRAAHMVRMVRIRVLGIRVARDGRRIGGGRVEGISIEMRMG